MIVSTSGKKLVQRLDVTNISHRPVWHLCLLSLKQSSLFPVTVVDAAHGLGRRRCSGGRCEDSQQLWEHLLGCRNS